MDTLQDGHDHGSELGLAVDPGHFPVDEAVIEGKSTTAVLYPMKCLIYHNSNAVWDEDGLC